MKKAMCFVLVSVFAAAGANAYFNGGADLTTGPGDYRGTNLYFTAGTDNFWLTPSMATYNSDALKKTRRTFQLRAGYETELYTLAGLAGMTPEVSGYSNNFAGGDITVSLTPGKGGKSRLAGPNARAGGSGGGAGVTRIDVGAGLKHTIHDNTIGTDTKTGQTEFSLFAGARVLMAQLGASYTGYAYGEEKAAPELGTVPGLNFARSAYPRSSINARVTLPGYPLVTPFVAYTGTKYKAGGKDSSAYLFGADLDLNMVAANVAYQIFNDGSARTSFISIGAGIKF